MTHNTNAMTFDGDIVSVPIHLKGSDRDGKPIVNYYILQEIMGGGKARYSRWLQANLGEPMDPKDPKSMRLLTAEGMADMEARYLCECLYHSNKQGDVLERVSFEELEMIPQRVIKPLYDKARTISGDRDEVEELEGKGVAADESSTPKK